MLGTGSQPRAEGPVLAGGSPLTLLSRPQEGPEAELLGGERSVFYLLMKMFVASAHSQLKSSTKRLIVKVSAPGSRRSAQSAQ